MIILPKIYTRDFPLILLQIWGRRYQNFFRVKVDIFPRNVCVFRDGVWDAYRNPILNHAVNDIILEHLSGNSSYVQNLFLQSEEKIRELKDFCSRTDLNRQEFLDFLNFLLEYWNSLYAGLHIPLDERFSKEDRERALRFRKETDQFEYQVFGHVRPVLQSLYPNLGKLADFLLLEEVDSGNIPDISILFSRSEECLILVDDGLVSLDEFDALQKEFDFNLEQPVDVSVTSEFSGQVACRGKIRGKARLVIKDEDIASFRQGEVLVSPMTIPTFLPAMQKAIAFITDEGGITCHAAIVARELKKPCIIGTKIATQVLHDGDLVEVDADNGVVRIIERMV